MLLNWGKVNTPGKSEVKHFPDSLLAERWAADSVTDKLKHGCGAGDAFARGGQCAYTDATRARSYVVHEGEGSALLKQEGMPRVAPGVP